MKIMQQGGIINTLYKNPRERVGGGKGRTLPPLLHLVCQIALEIFKHYLKLRV